MQIENVYSKLGEAQWQRQGTAIFPI